MARRKTAMAISPVVSLFPLLVASLITVAASAQPAVTRVASRMVHGSTPFDIPLPQVGEGGIECRALTGGVTIVVTFDRAVNGGTAAVSAGAATVGAATYAGATMTIPLTNVTNAQAITVALTNVTDAGTGTPGAAAVSFRVLEGDVNGSGSVTVSDINQVKYLFGSPITGATFRADLVRDASIGTPDLNLVKLRINTALGGPAPNTPPTISNIADQSTPAGTAMPAVSFTVGDAESGPEPLFVSATSSDPLLVPANKIALSGSGATRGLAITPGVDASNQPLTGTATITVTVSDGVLVTNDTFLLTVGSPQKLYVAALRPESSGTVTPASGSAMLLVDASETQATLRFSYTNLTTNKTAAHVHGPADPGQVGGIVFDIDAATPEQDGSYTWTFQQTGNTTVQDIRDALKSGRLYLNIHTAKYPDGELRGHFNFAAGSTTFTPPPPPPPLPGGPPTDQDAARFLIQATFGPAADDTTDPTQARHTIAALKQAGFDAWLSEQFATPTTRMKDLIEARYQQSSPVYPRAGSNVTEGWWYLVLRAPDQLRQRVALALSEIFVVSKVEEAIEGQPLGVASYHDMLADNAFGNFRTLLKDVTLHPVMGQYLNMRGNKKPTSPLFTAPNENYAREVLQLFSIGLNQMHPDGTLKLEATGLPLETYNQNTIESFAHVFTGWDFDSTQYAYSYWDPALVPPALNTGGRTSYVRPMTVRSGNHSNINKTLLNGFVIQGLASYTTATANAELDAALNNIFNHPNVGPFIARRLIQRLVTSNPTPAYIYRVSEVFRDNGQGVRGDMKAVVRAILTDYEARTTDLLGNQAYGRLKEPVIRAAQVIRAFHPTSVGTPQYWRLASTDTEFLQTPYKSPTVFNFFEPDYVVSLRLTNPNPKPGQPTTYVQTLGTPEMQIVNENTAITTANYFNRGLITAISSGFSSQSDVRLALDYEQNLATAAAGDALVAHLNRTLMAGQMPPHMQSTLKSYYTTTTDKARRTRGLIYLVAASPQFAVQK